MATNLCIWVSIKASFGQAFGTSKLNFKIAILPQNWNSILTVHFDIGVELQYWQDRINPVSSILKFLFNIEVNCQFEFQFLGKMSILKFNFEVPKTCPNEAKTLCTIWCTRPSNLDCCILIFLNQYSNKFQLCRIEICVANFRPPCDYGPG